MDNGLNERRKGRAMNKLRLFIYGHASPATLEKASEKLPLTIDAVYSAHELIGYGMGYSFTHGYTPTMRNEAASLLCNVLLIIDRPKYSVAVVRKFRARGHRVFWYRSLIDTLTEEEVRQTTHWCYMPKAATWEPDLWAEQYAKQQEEIDAYLYEHPESLRGPDAIPTFGWTERFDPSDIDVPSTDALHHKRHAGSMDEETI